MTRATDESMGALHGLVCDSLIEQIKAYKAANEPIPPALLAQAIKLLKDNGIDQPARKGNKVDTLKDVMPDFDGDNVLPFSASH